MQLKAVGRRIHVFLWILQTYVLCIVFKNNETHII